MKRIEEIIEKSAMKFGLIVVESTIKNDSIEAILYSKTRNVNIGDLENVTREIQSELAEIGLDNVYSVSLASPGLDRILKTEKELQIFSDRLVKVSYFEDDKLVVKTGKLLKAENGFITLESEDGEQEKVNLQKIASVQLWDKLFEGGKKK